MSPSTWLPATRTRSLALFLAITFVVLLETAALHIWLIAHHSLIAWTATSLSLLTILWLGRTYRAQARAGLDLHPDHWHILFPGRLTCEVPLDSVASVTRPDWRHIPAPGARWVNGAAPLDPNVLLTLRKPLVVHLPFGLRRRVSAIGLHLLDPQAALDAWQARATPPSPGAT